MVIILFWWMGGDWEWRFVYHGRADFEGFETDGILRFSMSHAIE